MNREQAVKYLSFSGFSDEQIKAIEGAFTCETCEDAISKEAVFEQIGGWIASGEYEFTNATDYLSKRIKALPPVNSQKSICPSAGIDCEDCPAYEDAISRKAVLDTLENMDKALDEDRTVENYKELLRECYKVLPKSEWQHDHEILKAYSDGASAVLDKVRAEIEQMNNLDYVEPVTVHEILQIIDKYAEEVKA